MKKQVPPLSLDDKMWFQHVSFKEIDTLNDRSEITLPILKALRRLSWPLEIAFALSLFVLSLSPFWLVESFGDIGFVLGYLPLFVGLLFIRFLLIRGMYGTNKKGMVISNEQLSLSADPLQKISATTVSKSDVREVRFSYNMNRGQDLDQHTFYVSLFTAQVILNSGERINIDGNRVGLFNVLYLLTYFKYPLVLNEGYVGGASSIVLLFMRFFPILANLFTIVKFGGEMIF